MKAQDFASIYGIISKEPFEKITPEILSKLLSDNQPAYKFGKVTNKTLNNYRLKVRTEIIQNL